MSKPSSCSKTSGLRSSAALAVCVASAVLLAGCTTGPLAELGRSRRAEADGPGSLDQITERILEAEQSEPIPPDEPEIRVPEADRAMVETLQARDLNVRYTERGVVVTLPDVVFEFGSSRLTHEAHRKIRDVADVLLHEARGRAVAVEGHTDSIGAELYNQGLSERRAVSVADSLTDQGVSARLVTTKGYGSAYPIAANEYDDGSDYPEGRMQNRRVEIVIAN